MTRADPAVLAAVHALIEDAMGQGIRPLVLGICGSQGSGKSTLAAALADDLVSKGRTCAVLSLDDFYLTQAQRKRLASEVHPLCITRGPPGTHDVQLGIEVLDALRAGTPVRLPRFDKALDDRIDPADWPLIESHCDVIVFEGWCVGAMPQLPEALAQPVNALEQHEDPDGAWRRFVNAAVAGPYQQLFARIDRLVLLQAPRVEVVMDWRLQQEEELRARSGDKPGVMSSAQLARFIQHYERITRHILSEMPGRADLLIRLDEHRGPTAIERRR